MSLSGHSFQDKVVLVTGCASGIGLSTVYQLLKHEIKYFIKIDFLEDIRDLKSGGTAAGGPYGFVPVGSRCGKCDVSEDEEIAAAYCEGWQCFGYIDVVINCAGITNESKWKQVMKVNQWGVIESSLQAWGRMRKDRGGLGGTIINVSSVAAVLPVAAVPVYCATKAGVKLFSESLGDPFHYEHTQVRVVTVCPVLSDTPILDNILKCCIDRESAEVMNNVLSSWKMDSADDVAKSILEVYHTASSGTSWLVTDCIKKIPTLDITIA